MINNISFSAITKPQLNNKAYQPNFGSEQNDVFVKSKPSFEEIIANAKEKIMEVLKRDNVEYGYTIAKDGRILGENCGDEHHCTMNALEIEPDSVLMHGHPVPLPLSAGDIAILLLTPAKSMEAVTIDGKHSKLSKKSPMTLNSSYSTTYYELEKQLMMKTLDHLGIDYKLNQDDILTMFQDLCEYVGGSRPEFKSIEEAEEKATSLGIDILNPDFNKTRKQIESLMMYPLMFNPDKYDKTHHTILQNTPLINEYLDTEEGIKLRNDFVQDIANQYGLEYDTNLFD